MRVKTISRAAAHGSIRGAPPEPSALVRALPAVEDLLTRANGGVALVVAPGGYGKTSQVALWARHDPRTLAWVDLDPADDDPETLLSVLVEALSLAADLQVELHSLGRRSPHQYATSVAPALGHALRRCETPFVLVLDDVHLVHTESSVDLLDALVRNVPAASTVVLIGRLAPPLSLASARVHGRVIDVTTAQLALDGQAAREVVEAMGAQLDDRLVDDVLRDTEGWPLGIRLVGRAVAEQGDPAPGGPSVRGAADEVRAFVEAEWLRGLPPDDADFLRRVSGLGWICGALCDHVLDASDSGMRLERLASSGLLVTPLDRRGDSFRVHQVVQDALDEAFRRRDRATHCSVHRRASEWFESTGDIDRAVDQAIRAGDLARAGRLVMEHGALYHTRGRTLTVRRWLDELPRPYVLASPGLCLVAAVISLGAGDGEAAAAWTRFGEHALLHGDGDPDASVGPRLRAFRSMLWIDDVEDSLTMAKRACDELPPGLWRALACTTRGALSFALGDDATAIAALSEGAADFRVIEAPTVEAVCLAHLAIVLGAADRWDRALPLARSARTILHEHALEHMPTLALVIAVSALAEATDGEPHAARSDILLARTHLAFLHSVADWHHLQARIALTRASMLLSDLVGARTFLHEAETLVAQHPDAVGAKQQVADLATDLHSARNLVPCGPSSLTTAELRVLHYLPTNLSHEEIARRLYVSRNTVKSHAAAIYRKLGADSRSQSVELARAIGLLPKE